MQMLHTSFAPTIVAIASVLSLPCAPRAVGDASAAGDASAVATAPQSAANQERPLVAGRLERWLTDGDKDLIVQSFRRHPDEVLPFFDQYLERGMKLLEGNASDEEAMKAYRIGVKFAQLATDALRDPIFIEYAGSFASWNHGERTRFRRGQAAYKEGAVALKNGDLGTAMERFKESETLAEPLGDSWGLQMALTGQSRVAAAQDDWQRASDIATKAMDVAGRLQLHDDEIEMITLCAEARQKLALQDAGLGHARLAWSKLRKEDATEMRERVAKALVFALEAKNFRDEAAKIRREAGLPAAPPSTAPATSAPATPRPATTPPVTPPPAKSPG